MSTPIKTINIADDPDSGLKRKVTIEAVHLQGARVQVKYTVRHFVNNAGAYGAEVVKYRATFDFTTAGKFIDTNAANAFVTKPVNPNNLPAGVLEAGQFIAGVAVYDTFIDAVKTMLQKAFNASLIQLDPD